MILALLTQTLVAGTVTGDSARPISGAVVEIKVLERSATTSARGGYALTVDKPGSYLLEVRALGFSPVSAVEFSTSTGNAATCGGGIPMPAAYYMIVYVDGVRIWAPGSRDPPDFDQLRNNQYQGIEIYRGSAELPVQYQGTGAACGAILLWSRVQ